MKTEKHVLGEYIEQAIHINSDLKYGLDDVRGCSNTKKMMQTRANMIDRTFEKFYVVKPSEFVFNRRTTRNGEKIGMAYNDTSREYIFTNDYVVFRIKPEFESVLLSDYLYLFFCRDEFDRYARYMSTGSATEFFNWEDMCAVPFEIPPIEQQKKLTKAWKAIEKRIELKRQINDNLFEQTKVMLQKLHENSNLFDEQVTLDDFCVDIVSGGTPSRTCAEYWNSNDVPWLKNGEIKNNIIFSTEESISFEGLDGSSAKLVPPYSVNMAMYCVSEIQVSLSCIPLCTNQAVLNFSTQTFREACFIYYLLAAYGNELTSQANGSAQQNLSKEKIVAYKFLAPRLQEEAFDFLEANMTERINIAKEIAVLTKMLSILLSQLSS